MSLAQAPRPVELEETAWTQVDVIFDHSDAMIGLSYPVDPKERLRYLADNYWRLPMSWVINDTMMASAQRADQWVETRNETAGKTTHLGGHMDALKNALDLGDTEENVWISTPRTVLDSIRNICNGNDSFGEETTETTALMNRAIRFHVDLKEAGLSDDLQAAFRHIFRAEGAKKYLVDQLEDHWIGQPTESFPLHALSSLRMNKDPERHIRGFWEGRAIRYTQAGVGLLPTMLAYEHHLNHAYASIRRDARTRFPQGKRPSQADSLDILAQMQAVVNLRTSERAHNETVNSFRVPLMAAFKNHNAVESKTALEDLLLHNPALFTPVSIRLLGLNYEEIAELMTYKEQEESARQTEKELEHELELLEIEEFLRDCESPEVREKTCELVRGKIIFSSALDKKHHKGEYRFVQPGFMNAPRPGRGRVEFKILVVRQVERQDDGSFVVSDEHVAASVPTGSMARRLLMGEVEIVEDAQIVLPPHLQGVFGT